MNKQKKKTIIILLLIISVIELIILLWPRPKYVEINFDTNGGTPVDNIYVKKGSIITLPETSKTGYTFAGWYQDNVKMKEKTFALKENMKLVAKWLLSPVTGPEEKPIIFEIHFN